MWEVVAKPGPVKLSELTLNCGCLDPEATSAEALELFSVKATWKPRGPYRVRCGDLGPARLVRDAIEAYPKAWAEPDSRPH